MSVCPVCNGFQSINVECPSCGESTSDQGRVMDYYDDYSAYMPIDQMKLINGFQHDFELKQCPHLIECSNCSYQTVYMIQE